MTRPIAEFSQHNALGFQGLVKVIIVFPILQHNFISVLFFHPILVLDVGYFFPEIVVEGEPIHEKVVDLESIELLLILDQLHGESLSFLGDQTDGDTLFEDADFREDHFDLPVHLVDGIKLDEEPAEKLLSFALGEL